MASLLNFLLLNLTVLITILFSAEHIHSQLPSSSFIEEKAGIDPTKTPVYIVHVRKPFSLSHSGHPRNSISFRELKNWYMSFLPNATLFTGEPRMVYIYRVVISGFAARLNPDEVKAMEDLPGFITAYPEQEHYASTTYTPFFLGLRGAPSNTLWPDSNMGAGQIIGVIDSGVDPTHLSFSEAGMPPPPTKWNGKCFWGNTRTCNNKLVGAVGFRYRQYINPYDNHGHGTHVATTAAGNFVNNAAVNGEAPGTASGMAPRAHIAVYKVLFPDPATGGTVGTDADILAGIEQAIRDNVDILQMSLGATNRALYQAPVIIGSFAAMTRRIVPCAAMGNDGPTPSILSNDAPWILTVGASTTDRRITTTVQLGNGSELAVESVSQFIHFPSTQLPLVFPAAMRQSKAEHIKLKQSGKMVMCIRLGRKDNEHYRSAAIVLLNNWKEEETSDACNQALPAFYLSKASTEIVSEYYKETESPTATVRFRRTQFGVRPAPVVADFSSRGPSLTNGGIIKPDVIAPGVDILAAWPRPAGATGSYFNFQSGTSMATPHVSGVVALLKNKFPTWSPAAIKSAIMTTAYTLDLDGNLITDGFNGATATVFQRGAGHIDPESATHPGLIYDLNYYHYVHYLCGYYKSSNEVALIIQGQADCAQVRGIEPEQLNLPSFGITLGRGRPAVIVTRWVTNVGDAGSVYNVRVDEPEGVIVEVSPAALQFFQVGQQLSYQVKFSVRGGLPAPAPGEAKDGRLSWDSGKYFVSSPIVVTFV